MISDTETFDIRIANIETAYKLAPEIFATPMKEAGIETGVVYTLGDEEYGTIIFIDDNFYRKPSDMIKSGIKSPYANTSLEFINSIDENNQTKGYIPLTNKIEEELKNKGMKERISIGTLTIYCSE